MKRLFLLLFAGISISAATQAQDAVQVNGDTYKADAGQRELFIPNAFTPNGDGLNDYFKIVNLKDEKVLDFRIFNRWGTILYRSNNNQAAWDGKSNQKIQPAGVYGYMMKVGFPDGRIATYKGTVTLLN